MMVPGNQSGENIVNALLKPGLIKKEEEQIEISAHYSGYLEKQEADIIAFRKDENLIIPETLIIVS